MNPRRPSLRSLMHEHIRFSALCMFLRILQTALGGNSCTAVISNVSPADIHVDVCGPGPLRSARLRVCLDGGGALANPGCPA